MDQTKNLKKPADIKGMERVRARKDLSYYPVPDYFKALGVSNRCPWFTTATIPFFPWRAVISPARHRKI